MRLGFFVFLFIGNVIGCIVGRYIFEKSSTIITPVESINIPYSSYSIYPLASSLTLEYICDNIVHINDCVQHKDYERWDEKDIHIYKLIEKGKSNYHRLIWFAILKEWKETMIPSLPFGDLDYYKKVPCPQ